jgi:hydroxypyruvate isomerase
MTDRREFLKTAGAGIAATMTIGRAARGTPADPPWLTYAINAEMFWKDRPFLDRLKKIAEVGFTRYEFGHWKTKDIEAITRANEELGLQPSLFSAFRGIASSKRKDAFVEAVELSVEVAQKLGSPRLAVGIGERIEGLDRDEQVDAAIDALKAVSEKLAEAEVTLILEPLDVLIGRPRPLIVTLEDAAALVKEVGSPHVKILLDLFHNPAGAVDLGDQIARYRGIIGYYQVAGQPPRPAAAVPYARILRQVHDLGYSDPIGVELWPKGDPQAAIQALREADAAARAL